MIKLTLPMPVTLNQLYAGNWRRRYKSEKYKEWIELASQEYYRQWEEYSISGDSWMEAKYTYYTKIYNKNWTKKIKDVDNYLKWLNDFLATVIPWFEDHHIKITRLEKIHYEWEWYVEINIKEIK